MRFRSAARTDTGRRREQNEDAVLIDHPLYAVADGMGGHRAGEVASGLALDILKEAREQVTSEGPEALREIVREANRTVWSRGREDRALEGMGTTLTAAWVHGEQVTLAHVGDSRAYLLRGGTLSRLTEDQTLVAQLEREGKIAPGEAERHPQRNILTQAIGSAEDIEVDMTTVELVAGDRLLLATDGLHGVLGDEERIRDILMGTQDADEACGLLVDAANDAGGDDNVTVLILDAVSEGAAAAAGDGGTAPVIVSKPPVDGARPARLPGMSRKLVLALAVGGLAAFVLAMLFVSSRDPGFLVGTNGRSVAILQGEAGRDGAPPDAEVIRVYEDLPLTRFPRTVQRDLRTGIEVGSLREAERVIATLPRTLGPDDTPSPSPAPTATPSPASPTPRGGTPAP